MNDQLTEAVDTTRLRALLPTLSFDELRVLLWLYQNPEIWRRFKGGAEDLGISEERVGIACRSLRAKDLAMLTPTVDGECRPFGSGYYVPFWFDYEHRKQLEAEIHRRYNEQLLGPIREALDAFRVPDQADYMVSLASALTPVEAGSIDYGTAIIDNLADAIFKAIINKEEHYDYLPKGHSEAADQDA